MNIFSRLRNTAVTDQHGQPIVKAFRAAAVKDRNIDELVGMIKGVLMDGEVNQNEAFHLLRWLEANREVLDTWPASVIYPRLKNALLDNQLDEAEASELLTVLVQSVGSPIAPENDSASFSTALPLSKPPPQILFDRRRFCVTGHFASGTRAWVMEQIETRGGEVSSSVTKKLDYLVIGELGSRDWKHSTHGTKIIKAIEWQDKGIGVAIVSEQHWHSHL